ncbi:MAG: signal peptidase II [Geminicoccaceae bacterium]
MFSGSGDAGRWALTAMALLVGAGLMVWFFRERRNLPRLCIAMIVAGALGNVIDRLRFGAVVDFLDFHAMGYHWPAFNIAGAQSWQVRFYLRSTACFFRRTRQMRSEKRGEMMRAAMTSLQGPLARIRPVRARLCVNRRLIALAACSGTVQEKLGINQRAPDEVQVIRRAPLELPPTIICGRRAGRGRVEDDRPKPHRPS